MQSDEEVGKVAQAVPVIIYILFQNNCFIMFIMYYNKSKIFFMYSLLLN